MNGATYGSDLAKRVFQVQRVEIDTVSSSATRWREPGVAGFFFCRPPGIAAMDSCGSAHDWGRLLSRLGREVRLIAAQFVRPFVKTSKTGAADAEAIWEAAQRPGMRVVARKSEEQQAALSLQRMPARLVKACGMQAYPVRRLLYEFGVVTRRGFAALKVKAVAVLGQPEVTRCPSCCAWSA